MNFQLLNSGTDREAKNGKELCDWINNYTDPVKKTDWINRHLIPDIPELWKSELCGIFSCCVIKLMKCWCDVDDL